MASSLLLVGAGQGMGLAIARRFGREGFRVGVVARNETTLGALAEELQAEGVEVHTAVGDAGDPPSLRAAIDALTATLGTPDVLVYNVVAVPPGTPSTITSADLLAAMAPTLGGLVDTVGAVVPAMRERRSGTVVVTGGGAATDPWVDFVGLGMGKAAQRNYTQALHREVIDDDVHATTVTIRGVIAPDTPFDPALIAEEYWTAHTRPRAEWVWEVSYRPTA